jgi:hypothetical protein
MRPSTTFLIAVLVIGLLVAGGPRVDASSRRVVIPTYYGYGVVNYQGGYVSPYIAGYSAPWLPPNYASAYLPYPASYNRSYLPGYYPYYGAAGYVPLQPHWNGVQWSYSHGYPYSMGVITTDINMRSSPQVSGAKKSRTANIIAQVGRGEAVYLLGQSGNWLLVQSAGYPLRRGYVYRSYVQVTTASPYYYGAYSPVYY